MHDVPCCRGAADGQRLRGWVGRRQGQRLRDPRRRRRGYDREASGDDDRRAFRRGEEALADRQAGGRVDGGAGVDRARYRGQGRRSRLPCRDDVSDGRAIDRGLQDVAGEQGALEGRGRGSGIDRRQGRRSEQAVIERWRAGHADWRGAGEQRRQRPVGIDPKQTDCLKDEGRPPDRRLEASVEKGTIDRVLG